MKFLKNITLLNLNCVDPDVGVRALRYSSREITFGRKVLISDTKPDNISDDIEYIFTEKLTRESINRFYFTQLDNFIDTEFMLSIQTDGFVINPHKWSDEFLQYDYVGAPWPKLGWCARNRVGNGGFVLISKKFLRLLKDIPYRAGHNDQLVTNVFYNYFVSNGCKYAPLEVASKFSLEHVIPEVEYNLNNCFGFHGMLTPQSRAYSEMIKTYEE